MCSALARPHDAGDLLRALGGPVGGEAGVGQVEAGELLGAVAEDPHVEGLEALEGGADVEDRLHPRAHDRHRRHGQGGEVGRLVPAVARLPVDAAEPAGREDPDARRATARWLVAATVVAPHPPRWRAIAPMSRTLTLTTSSRLATWSSASSSRPMRTRPSRMAIVAGTAPRERTMSSTSVATRRFSGRGSPWLMMVDSRATTAVPAASASDDLVGDLDEARIEGVQGAGTRRCGGRHGPTLPAGPGRRSRRGRLRGRSRTRMGTVSDPGTRSRLGGRCPAPGRPPDATCGRSGPDDGDALRRFHAGLSPRTVYFRFFSAKPELTDADVEYFTHVDHRSRVALLALDRDEIIGVGRFDVARRRARGGRVPHP